MAWVTLRASHAAFLWCFWIGRSNAAAGDVWAQRSLLTVTKAEYDGLTEIPILSPVPLTGGWVGGHTMRIGAELAMDIINSQQTILPGYRLNTSWFDDQCNPDVGAALMLQKWNEGNYAALGANGCSAVCKATALISPSIRIPHISYGCAAGFLNDPVKFPNFARMMTDESSMADVFHGMSLQYNWTRMVIISGSGARFDSPSKYVEDFFKDEPLDVEWLVPRNPSWDELIDLMKIQKREFQRVMVVLGYEPFYRRVVCASWLVGIPKGVVWLSVGWHKKNWWLEDDADLIAIEPQCTGEKITEYYNGGIGAAGLGAPLASNMEKPLECLTGWTSKSFRELLETHFIDGYPLGSNILPGDAYTGIMAYGADGICMWAYMFRYMIFDEGHSLSELFRPTQAVYKKMVTYHKTNLSFFGVGGQIGWGGENNLPGVLAVNQVQGGNRILVNTLDLQGVMHPIAGTTMVWGDGETSPASSFAPCPLGTLRAPDGSCKSCNSGEYYYEQDKECLACEVGKYNPNAGSIGSASCFACADGTTTNVTGSDRCKPCLSGTFSSSQVGLVECALCDTGKYQPNEGGVECDRCETGKYQDQTGRDDCNRCPGVRTTKFLSAVQVSDCVCPVDTFEPLLAQRSSAHDCSPCPEGMTCVVDSRLDNWNPSTKNASGPIPQLMMQYYATVEAPTYVYRCLDQSDCPGGDPGVCAVMRVGLSCGRCAQGYYAFGGKCNECSELELTAVLFPVFPILVGPLMVVLIYTRLLEPFRVKHVDSLKNRALALLFFFLVQFQTLGILRQMNLALPDVVRIPWEVVGMVNSGVQFLRPECAGGGGLSSFSAQFTLRTLLPVVVAIYFVLVYFALKFSTRYMPLKCFGADSVWATGMLPEFVFNAFFTVMYSFSIAVLAIAFDLFKCFPHPNGLSSLRVAPNVLCNSSEWMSMLVVGLLAILVYCVGSFALFTYAIFIAPGKWHDPVFRRQWKFLFVKWRPDRWWFGQVFLLKGMLLNITLVAFQDGILQVLWVGLILIVYVIMVVFLQAWRHTAASMMDVLVSLSLLCVAMISVYFASSTGTAAEVLDEILVIFTILPIPVALGSIAWLVYLMIKYPRREIGLGIQAALSAHKQLQKTASFGILNLVHGMTSMTNGERNQVLQAIQALSSEASGTQAHGMRIIGRDASFDQKGRKSKEFHADRVYGSVTEEDAEHHQNFHSWCSERKDVETDCQSIFGGVMEIQTQLFETKFQAIFGNANLGPRFFSYVAALCDVYEDGMVTREAFTSMVIGLKETDRVKVERVRVEVC